MRLKQTEKQIENSILDYLDAKGYYAIKHNRVGVYDEKLGVFRKPKTKYQRVGIADIQFFVWYKRYISNYTGDNDSYINEVYTIFLEVKSKTGKQSEAQKEFQRNVEKAGCVYRVVRSIDDVEKLLKELIQ